MKRGPGRRKERKKERTVRETLRIQFEIKSSLLGGKCEVFHSSLGRSEDKMLDRGFSNLH